MTVTGTAPTFWPPGVPRRCANGDGRKTLVLIDGKAHCGPCALAHMKARDALETT